MSHGFVRHFCTFSLQVRWALTIAGVFCELENTGTGKRIILEKKKNGNPGFDYGFSCFGMFRVFAAGECAYKRIVTMS